MKLMQRLRRLRLPIRSPARRRLRLRLPPLSLLLLRQQFPQHQHFPPSLPRLLHLKKSQRKTKRMLRRPKTRTVRTKMLRMVKMVRMRRRQRKRKQSDGSYSMNER